MLTFRDNPETDVFELEVDGQVSREEFDAIIAALEARLKTVEKLNVVEIVSAVGWLQPSLWWQDMSWGFRHLDRFERCAIVTDHGWIGPLVHAAAALFPIEIRTFRRAEIEAAREWAATGQVSRTV